MSSAAKYAVEYKQDGASNWLSASANVTGTSYTISGFRCGRGYDIQVKSYGNGTTALAQWSLPSGTLDASTSSCAVVAPPQPTNARIATVPGAPASLRVTFSRATGSTHNYKFQLYSSSFSAGTYTAVTEANGGVATATTSPVTFTGLTRGKWYKAKGQNCSSASHTSCSALIGFTSAIELPAAAGTTTASLSPDPATATFRNVGTEWHTFPVSSTENVNVVANPGSGTPKIVLWPSDPRGADQCGFIENDDRRSRSNGQSIYIAGCAAGSATVELRKVSDNSVLRTYTFTVTDGSTPGQCTRSRDDCPSAPAAPTGLRVTASAINNIAGAWNPVSGASKYAVGYREDAASMWTETADNITGTSYTLTSLDCGTAYDIGVRAVRVVANLPDIKGDWATTDLSAVSCDVFGSGILQLDDTSPIWRVPSGITDVYLDVALSDPRISDTNSGYIRVQELDYRGDYVDVKRVKTSADTGPLTGVSGGDTLRIKVDPDVFDDSAATVTLTFHRGQGINTPITAKATVQKQQRPNAPTNPTASVNTSTGAVSLSWTPGASRPQAAPHHYEVEIVSAGLSPVTAYTETNVTSRSLQISDAWDRGFAGDLQGKVRHCNSVGGCSPAAVDDFTQPPFDISPGFRDENRIDSSFASVEWNILEYGKVYLGTQGLPGNYEYRLQSTRGTGLQTDGQACDWSVWPNAFSSWTDTDAFTPVVRCGMGDGPTDFKIWSRSKTTGLQFKTPNYERELGLPGHMLSSTIQYAYENPLVSGASAARITTYKTGIETGADAWDAVTNSYDFQKIDNLSANNVVTVQGYETSVPDTSTTCGNYKTIACVKPSGRDTSTMHQGAQTLYFEHPPVWNESTRRQWTNNITTAMDPGFEYMPAIMTHEFGHTAGLHHSPSTDDIMGPFIINDGTVVKTQLSSYDIAAMRVIYSGRNSHTD